MWMDKRIYNDEANSQARNIEVCILTTQKDQSCKILS